MSDSITIFVSSFPVENQPLLECGHYIIVCGHGYFAVSAETYVSIVGLQVSAQRCGGKKALKPDKKGTLAVYMTAVHRISQRQATSAVHLAQSSIRYKRKPKCDEEVIGSLQELVIKHPAIDFWQRDYCICRKGFLVESKTCLRGIHSAHVCYFFRKRINSSLINFINVSADTE